MSSAEIRSNDASRKSAKRAEDRDLKIPKLLHPQRRLDCLADVYLALKTYFPDIFTQPFTTDRREMIDAIIRAARYVGDQAVAGPRADGKTTSAMFCALQLMLGVHLMLPIVISKSGPRATRELKDWKHATLNSPLLLEDFPEIFYPIHMLGGWSSRARQQTAHGHPTQLEWGEDCIIFPTIPSEVLWEAGWNLDIESAARGQAMASLGIEGPIRGFKVRSRRPDLAILDDIDDRESARSELQTETRELIIEEDVGGLAGPDRTISRVMLCTLINQSCIAATFTDITKKPSWKGQRHKLLEKEPDHPGLWEEYIGFRQGRDKSDPDARVAFDFYVANREAMDAGAIVTNPYRFDSRPLADGKPAELSALQACFNLIADRGRDHFDTEYQNDPPATVGPVESGITPHRIQRQVSGHPQGEIPPGYTLLTRGIDCRKTQLHWVVRAWKPDGSGTTIDYNVYHVTGTVQGTDEGLDVALRRAILAFLDESAEFNYATPDGECIPIKRTCIDAAWRSDAVYQACLEAGMGIEPLHALPNFHDVLRRTADRIPGDGWFKSKKTLNKTPFWLVCTDADRWKAWEHDRWLTTYGTPGCMSVYGEANPNPDRLSAIQREHKEYANQICAEVEVEEPTKDGKMKRYWKVKTGHGSPHYLDASCYADVAASMEGIRVLGQAAASKPRTDPANRPTLDQLANRR